MPESSPATIADFLDEVRGVLRRKHLSLRTEEAYLGRIRQFILFHGKKHPAKLGPDDICAF